MACLVLLVVLLVGDCRDLEVVLVVMEEEWDWRIPRRRKDIRNRKNRDRRRLRRWAFRERKLRMVRVLLCELGGCVGKKWFERARDLWC